MHRSPNKDIPQSARVPSTATWFIVSRAAEASAGRWVLRGGLRQEGVVISPLAIPLAISAAAAWAVAMTVAKPGIARMDRLSYMLVRWILVGAFALAYAWAAGTLAVPGWRPAVLAIAAGLMDGTAGGFFYLLAMERTSAYQTATLSSTAPLWGVIGSILILGDPLRWTVFVAAGLVVAGARFLVGRRSANPRTVFAGSLFALLTGILWGIAETVPSKLALDAGLAPAMQLFLFASSGLLGTVCLLPLLRHRIPRRTSRRGGLLVVLSAVGAFLGWILWLNSLKLAMPSVISPIRGSTMLFAFVYSVLFLRERPTPRAIVGLLLVLGGVLLVSFTT